MLQIEDMTAGPGRAEVLRGLELTVDAGERVGLLGASGSGKTTLLRCIAGFLRPRSGTIRIDDRTAFGGGVDLPPAQRGVSMVFQSYALWPHLTARQHLRLVARPGEDVERWLKDLRIQTLGDRLPAQLSGGEQARLALARALAARPRLLLLDEPFRNLDPGLAFALQVEILERFEREGSTVLFVTHEHAEAYSLATRVCVLASGRIVTQGTPQQVYEYAEDAEVARFLGRRMALPGELTGRGTLATSVGEIPLDPGSRGTALLLRPEDLRIDVAEPGNGEVCDARFEGASWLVSVLVGGRRLVARVPREQVYASGQSVKVSLRSGAPRRAHAIDGEEELLS